MRWLENAQRLKRPFMNSIAWRTLNSRWKMAERQLVRMRDVLVSPLWAAPIEKTSPFDVGGVKTKATTDDILSAVRESRAR
ncbi:prevent-host-death protein [Salinisphaera sp. T31B1]|uniref:prevent-host-death protein n=1 Tax=Salinisphaera sp. T31B1 TaxID=727963 RepID=UPI00333F35CF